MVGNQRALNYFPLCISTISKYSNEHALLSNALVNGHLGLFSVGALLNKAGVDFAC